jgi:hypothetical protein
LVIRKLFCPAECQYCDLGGGASPKRIMNYLFWMIMGKKNEILDLSFDFALEIIKLVKYLKSNLLKALILMQRVNYLPFIRIGFYPISGYIK